jgi:branched-chain amino acid transport system permease protein
MVSLYVAVAISLNLVIGEIGLLSVCQAAFYGIGAYTATLLVMNAHWSFGLSIAGTLVVASGAAICIGLPSLRLRGDYFVLATLGFQIIVFSVLYNWTDLTNGPNGIPGIPPAKFFGIELGTPARFLVASSMMTAAVAAFIFILLRSPFGRLMHAVRDDDVGAASLGKNSLAVRLTAFTLGSGLTAVAGAFYSGYARYIDPMSFTVTESILMISIVVIGGAGSFRGPVVGAVVLVLLPEVLRFLRLPEASAASLRQVLYGISLVLFMRLRPRGIAGEYGFD